MDVKKVECVRWSACVQKIVEKFLQWDTKRNCGACVLVLKWKIVLL